jgi:carbon-monoxide dehydrogenase medium subunit
MGEAMYELRYEEPATLDAAIGLITAEAGDVRILSGGTDVLVQMHCDMIEPALLVNIKNIGEMRNIEKNGGGYRIGAAVTGMELVNHPDFGNDWPGILDGVRLIGSIQVKGRATVAGNLCNASPAADSVPPLMTAGAIAHVVGPNGARDIPVTAFTTGPGQTALEKGEIVVSFSLPERAPRSGDAYLRFTPRTEMDIAVVGVAINLTLDDGGTCTDALVALGAVAEKALMVDAAGAALVGTKLDDTAMQNLAAAASAACRPIDDKRGTKEYRIKVAGVLARRAAAIAATRAGA